MTFHINAEVLSIEFSERKLIILSFVFGAFELIVNNDLPNADQYEYNVELSRHSLIQKQLPQ